MQRDNAVVEVSSGEDDETTESHTTTTEFLSDELRQAVTSAAAAPAGPADHRARDTISPGSDTLPQEEEPRRWKQAKAGSQAAPGKERRFSIGAKNSPQDTLSLPPSAVQGVVVEVEVAASPVLGGKDERRFSMGPKASSQDLFIEDVRKNQRRATITRGKIVCEDIWQQRGGFGEFLESERFWDVILEANGKQFRVHKLILAFSSEYFAELLLEKNKHKIKDNKIVLDAPDPDNVMPDIVKYMYTSEIVISAEKAVPLLAMADLYCITELKMELSSYITRNVWRENAVTLLRKALTFHADQVTMRCIDVVASNFAFIYDVNYDFLPYDLLVKLIYHKHLNILAEYDFFQHLRDYCLAHAASLSNEQRAHILSAVRYRWFTIDQLIQVMEEGLVPQRLLLEATFARLEQHEQGKEPRVLDVPLSLQPRPVYPVLVRYSPAEKGVSPGIIDWIGRGAGRREWTNPHLSGDIVVSASSLCKGVLADILSTRENELWSNDVPASWFCLDFGAQRSVIVTSYVLRHGGNYRADSLRNWDLQGSVDGWHWEVLMSHRHDQSLQGAFAIAHWDIPEHHQKAVRFCRVLQTGHNSSSRNFLVLSNIELFGKILDSSARVIPPSQ